MSRQPTPDSTAPAMPDELRAASDFSLMQGGPLYQLWRRTRLSGDALELLHRRALLLMALTWLPLLLLSMLGGHAWSYSPGELTFLRDLEMHVRLLVALPLLLWAELVVHRWTYSGVIQFLTNGLIPEESRAQFDAAIVSAMRLRNSVAMEVVLLLLVYGIGFVYLSQFHFNTGLASWYGSSSNGAFSFSTAGWWAALVSLPVFQFISLRWFYRLFIWGRLLFQVSRIKLQLMPVHPDRCGGIGFLSTISQGFAPVLLAQSTLLSGMIADRIFFAGARLPDFAVEIVGLVAFMMIAIFGPLFFFTTSMAKAKLAGLHEYSGLAQRYVREFDAKWLHSSYAPPHEPLMGSADFQSLADLGGSFEIVDGMRWVPITWRSMGQLLGIMMLPLAPLPLTMFPLDELLRRLVGILF